MKSSCLVTVGICDVNNDVVCNFAFLLGEAKNLSEDVNRDTICKVAFDQEPIFTTATVEKSRK